jgi:ribonuclease Z
MSVRFLGTSSQPSSSRNYSSLLVNLDRETVMVDCGEGTQRQLMNRHIGGEAKLASIHTILITHMHADHVLGLVPLLYSMMGPSSPVEPDDVSQQQRRTVR